MATVSDILGPTGVIAKRLDHFEQRDEQLAMAEGVQAAFDRDQHLVVEAGTGVGKSFAYLVPAIQRALTLEKTKRPIVVSTGTIALQEQLYQRDIPFLQSIWDDEFSSVLAKGRSNYVSLRRLDRAREGKTEMFEDQTKRDLERLREWAETTKDGTRASLDFQPTAEAWQQVVSDSNNCRGRACPNFEAKCFYQRAKRRIYTADILVVNHALLCADLALKANGVNYLPPYEYLIVDEAHDLERYASEHLGIRVTKAGLNYNLSQIYNAKRNRGLLTKFDGVFNGGMDLFRRARDIGDSLFVKIEQWANRQRHRPARVFEADAFETEVSDTLDELVLCLREGRSKLRSEDDKLEVDAHINRLRGYAQGVRDFVQQSLPNQVYWVESGAGMRETNVELRAAPVQVGPLLNDLMFERCKSVVLTSATMATGEGDFKYVRSRLGVPDETNQLQVGSPFNYRENAQIVVPDLPEPPTGGTRNDDYETLLAGEIKAAVTKSRGGTFVLFTSMAQLRRVHALASPELELRGFTVLKQGEGMARGRLLDQFKSGNKMVLFGVETFWQGVDVPGDALTTVVLVRIPFPVPTDPLVAARMEAVRKSGKSDFNQFMVPEATIKLRQGFGRLIRRKDDHGTVVILDRRIVTKGYGKRILRALPDCPVTDGRGRVANDEGASPRPA